jgi:hypothetical protein
MHRVYYKKLWLALAGFWLVLTLWAWEQFGPIYGAAQAAFGVGTLALVVLLIKSPPPAAREE